TANGAMKDGTRLAEEFATMNETPGASWEKVQKRFIEIITSDKVVSFMEGLVDIFARLIGVTGASDKEMKVWQQTVIFLIKLVAIFTAGWLSYNAGVVLNNKWIAINTVRLK